MVWFFRAPAGAAAVALLSIFRDAAAKEVSVHASYRFADGRTVRFRFMARLRVTPCPFSQTQVGFPTQKFPPEISLAKIVST